jgi:outer membrane protein assembly factor BamB
MSTATVIELGNDWSVPENQPRPWRTARSLRAGLVVLVTVLLLGGAAPARSAPFAPVTSIPVTSIPTDVALTTDAVYVIERHLGGSVVRAYTLTGGGPRWSVELTDPMDGLTPTPDGLALVAVAYGASSSNVTALDAATGKLLWQRPPATVMQVTNEAVVLTRYGPATKAGGAEPVAVSAVRLRTGVPIWSYPLSSAVTFASTAGDTWHQGPDRLVLAAPNGTVTVVDSRTGALLARESVASGAVVTGQAPAVDVTTSGDRVLVFYHTGASAVLASYDFGLHLRWQVTHDGSTGHLTQCGRVVCMQQQDGRLSVIDPGDGRILWRTTSWAWAQSVGVNRLITSSNGPEGQLALVEAGTGRQLADLGGWTELPTQPLLFTRGDRSTPFRTWFAILDLESATLRPVGFLDGIVAEGCRVAFGYLACVTLRHPLMVWRYPPGPG